MHKGDSSKLWTMVEKRNGELETVEAKYQNKMVSLREKESEHDKMKSKITKSMEKKCKDVV